MERFLQKPVMLAEKGKLTDHQETTMFRIVSSVCAAAMMLTLPLTTPGFAMPKAAPSWVEQGVTQVQNREWRGGNRQWRGDRQWRGNRNWQRPPHASPDFARRGGNYYYRGHEPAGRVPPARQRPCQLVLQPLSLLSRVGQHVPAL
jgi:hypothetical protein